MHFTGIIFALTVLSGLTIALPRPPTVTPPKAVPIKYDALHSVRSLNENAGVITRRAIESGAMILKPIKIHPSFAKRSDGDDENSIDFSRLDLSKQAQLIYGAPNSDGSVILANMTLMAPDGKPILMMENFETLTSAIDCNGSDGKLSLTFKSDKAMMYAHSKWAYINEKEEESFILIANHENCGPTEMRIPYLITDVKNDGLTTYLTAKEEKWENISGKFVIDFGKAQINSAPTTGARTRRGFGDFFNDVKNKVQEGTDKFQETVKQVQEQVKPVTDKVQEQVKPVTDKVQETVKDGTDKLKEVVQDGVDKTKQGIDAAAEKLKTVGGRLEQEILIPLSTGPRGAGAPLFVDPLGRLTVECADCNIAGSLKVIGRVAVEAFKPTELTFTASPVDLSTTIHLGVKGSIGTGDMSKPPTFSKSIATLSLGGIVIPQVFSLGPKLDFEMGASLTADHDVSFKFGIKAALPNGAVINANVLSPEKSSATGFEGVKVDLIPFTVDTFSGSMTASAFAMPVLSIGFEVLGGVFGAETAIKFKVPSINAEFSAEFDQLGVCKQGPGAKKTGVRVKSNGVAEARFFVGTDQTIGEVSAVNQLLFEKPFLTLPAACIEVDIPGLGPVDDTAPADDTTSTDTTGDNTTTVDDTAPVDDTTTTDTNQ